MQLIRTTLGHHINHTTGSTAELCLISGGDYFELLDRVLGKVLKNAAMEIIVVLEAINQKRCIARSFAQDGSPRVPIR